jgi:isopentenyldiphosphate isomerase
MARFWPWHFQKQVFIVCFIVVLTIFAFYSYSVYIRELEMIDISSDGHLGKNPTEITGIDRAHRQAIRHRGVWVFIVNENKHLLFAKRSDHSITCPSTWSVIGEHCHFGESYYHCAQRCIEEELDIHHSDSLLPMEDGPVLVHLNYGDRIDKQWTQVFLAFVKEKFVAKDDISEIQSILWRNFSGAEEWLKECPEGQCRSCNPQEVWKMTQSNQFSYYYTFLQLTVEYINLAEILLQNISLASRKQLRV